MKAIIHSNLYHFTRKKQIFVLAVLFVCMNAVAQFGSPRELKYEMRTVYARAVKKEKLNDAKVIGDVISGYPVNWITSYTSLEISATCNGKPMKAVSRDDVLTTEQKNILSKADLASDLAIHVSYKYRAPVSGEMENNRIEVKMTVAPETEAEPQRSGDSAGRYVQMIRYLKENSMAQIPITTRVTIRFTVNEEGEITNGRLIDPSSDAKTNKLLLELIHKMPKWKPAQNSQGEKVKQDFLFTVGNNEGC
jgi:TonB family protein